MADPLLQPRIDAAAAYETLLVPALFDAWAVRVAEAARVAPGDRVLDVACGTGILARRVLARVAPGGAVAGIDAAPGMLEVARRLEPAVDWRHGTAEELPFPDACFDRVVSQFGLMFFDDRERAIGEMLRVLKPGGTLAVAVWDALEANPPYAAEVALVERLAGAAAADALRAPFALGDAGALAALFSRAGAAAVRVATGPAPARFPSVRAMLEADVRGWLPAVGIDLAEAQVGRILEEGERLLAAWVRPGGAVAFETSAHVVTSSRA
jgi:SAM-dependent methyltransferase